MYSIEQIRRSVLRRLDCRLRLHRFLNRNGQDISIFCLHELMIAIFVNCASSLCLCILKCSQVVVSHFGYFLGLCRFSGSTIDYSNRSRRYDQFVIYRLVEDPISACVDIGLFACFWRRLQYAQHKTYGDSVTHAISTTNRTNFHALSHLILLYVILPALTNLSYF